MNSSQPLALTFFIIAGLDSFNPKLFVFLISQNFSNLISNNFYQNFKIWCSVSGSGHEVKRGHNTSYHLI